MPRTTIATWAAARRERLREETRVAILDATRRIVAEEGVDAFSMRAVARAVGYSPAALYEYFPSKEAILDELYFEGRDGLRDRMARVLADLPAGATTAEIFRELGRTYRAYAREQPELFRHIFGGPTPAEPSTDPSVDDAGPEPDEEAPPTAFDLLVETAERGIASGEFAPMPPPAVALAAWSLVHGFVMIELSGALSPTPPPGRVVQRGADPAEGPPAVDHLFEAAIDLMMQGFQRRHDPAPR
jgi:AcrR family transcriptional regulator